jgi:hypothetical protein
MIGMLMRKYHSMSHTYPFAHQLQSQFGWRIDQQIPFREA